MKNNFLTNLRGVTRLMLLTVAILFFHFNNVLAQGATTAALAGKVVDEKGEGLPGASIIALHEPTGTQYGTVSRDDGSYNIVNMRVGGPYKITVSFVGHHPQDKKLKTPRVENAV